MSIEAHLEAREVGARLLRSGFMLCIAESCTGGLLGSYITDIPGSSDYFLGGVQTYSYQSKIQLLGVKEETILTKGAVSQETAHEMAVGVRKLFSQQIPIDHLLGLSITGIAGPGGGTPQKPVGLVWIGLSCPAGDFTWQHCWSGNRVENKIHSATAALQHIIDALP